MRSLSFLLVTFLLLGCKSVEYIPVEKVKTETIYRYDTVRTADSVLINAIDTIIVRGDTVTKVKWRTRDIVRNVYKTKTDTVSRIECMEVPNMIVKDLTTWQKMRMNVGDVTLVALCGLLFWWLYEIIRDKINSKG